MAKNKIDAIRNLKAARLVKSFMLDPNRDSIIRKHRDLKGMFSTGLDAKIINVKKVNGKLRFNVCIDGLYNLVDEDCNVLSNIWFDYIDIFFGTRFTIVNLNHKFNYIDFDGKLLYRQPFKHWFEKAWFFVNGFGTFQRNGKENYIDAKGKILSKTWFKYTLNFGGNHFKNLAIVLNKKGKFALIKSDGKILTINGKKWFALINDVWIKNGDDYLPCLLVKEKIDTKNYMLIDKNGNQLPKQEFFNSCKPLNTQII